MSNKEYFIRLIIQKKESYSVTHFPDVWLWKYSPDAICVLCNKNKGFKEYSVRSPNFNLRKVAIYCKFCWKINYETYHVKDINCSNLINRNKKIKYIIKNIKTILFNLEMSGRIIL